MAACGEQRPAGPRRGGQRAGRGTGPGLRLVVVQLGLGLVVAAKPDQCFDVEVAPVEDAGGGGPVRMGELGHPGAGCDNPGRVVEGCGEVRGGRGVERAQRWNFMGTVFRRAGEQPARLGRLPPGGRDERGGCVDEGDDPHVPGRFRECDGVAPPRPRTRPTSQNGRWPPRSGPVR